MDMRLVQQYADRVMELVREDVRAGRAPATVRSFPELHEHLDANGYADDAGVPQPVGNFDLVNAVETRVSEMLSARQLEQSGLPEG